MKPCDWNSISPAPCPAGQLSTIFHGGSSSGGRARMRLFLARLPAIEHARDLPFDLARHRGAVVIDVLEARLIAGERRVHQIVEKAAARRAAGKPREARLAFIELGDRVCVSG